MSDARETTPFYMAESLHVEVYDVLGAYTRDHGSAGDDIQLFRRLAADTGGPILEIGCGTGRVCTVLAEDGYEVVGIDVSAPMLHAAERRRATMTAEAAARLSFQEADVTTLDLGPKFALIVAPSRVFQFALTSDIQRQALRALRAHLAPDGLLVLDLFDPLLEYVVPSPTGLRTGADLVHPTNGHTVRWTVTGRFPDPGRQLIVEDWTFEELADNGAVLRTATERLTLRWSLRAEMRLLFELEGLEVVADYGDFAGGPPAYGGEQVWVLKLAGLAS